MLSTRESMADDARNRGSQMATWESDAVIVPKIPGNAGGGKDGTWLGSVRGIHPLYTVIDKKGGYTTGQNKRYKAQAKGHTFYTQG